jgi:hypothetical protein
LRLQKVWGEITAGVGLACGGEHQAVNQARKLRLAAEFEHDACQVAEVVLMVRIRERVRVASENPIEFAETESHVLRNIEVNATTEGPCERDAGFRSP